MFPSFLSSSFHLSLYLCLPLGSVTFCLMDPLLLLTQTFSKQPAQISVYLCVEAPIQQKQLVYIFKCRRLISSALSALIITCGPEALWPQIFCHTPLAQQTQATVASKMALPSLIMSSVSSKIVCCGPVPDSLELLSAARLLTPTGQQLRSWVHFLLNNRQTLIQTWLNENVMMSKGRFTNHSGRK